MSTYYKQGFSSAVESKCALTSLCSYLDGTYDEITANAELSDADQRRFQHKLTEETKQYDIQKKRIESRIQTIKQLIATREQEIETYELGRYTRNEYSTKEAASNKFLPYALGVIITLGLTFFLILFYSSTGFTILFDVPASGNGILNPSVYSIALNHGGNALLFVLFFPFLFIAVGFATYITFDKYQKSNREEAHQARNWLILIIAFTFIIDAIIGYKITQGVYLRDYEIGLHTHLWSGEMIFTDVHFYLVLFLGFIAYLLWGVLLSFVLNHPYGNPIKNEVKDNDRTIILNEELLQLSNQLNDLEAKSVSLSNDINRTRIALQIIDNGGVPNEYMVTVVQHSIQEFTLG